MTVNRWEIQDRHIGMLSLQCEWQEEEMCETLFLTECNFA